MFATPWNKYSGLTKGTQYKVLDEGHDYKKLSVKGKPFYVPSFIFQREIVEEMYGPPEVIEQTRQDN